jgi:hexosaminidase
MKNILSLLLLLCFFPAIAQKPIVNLIPQPVDLKISSGTYILTKTSSITYNNAEGRKTAEMLTQKLNMATGFEFRPQLAKTGDIQLNLNESPNQQIGREGYTLESTSKGVLISANQPAGLFYGMQSLLQLLPKEIESKSVIKASWTIPAVKITDYPRFGWRGIMLDVSRNFFSKEDVKKYIDEMVRFKFNTFHWHLTDDEGWRIEIKSLPKLTKVGAWRVPRVGHWGDRSAAKPGEAATSGGFYTQADIKEIVQYAQDRNVTIVPEIDLPGHSMAAVASYPELSCTKDTSIKVDPGAKFSEWYGNGTFKMNIDNTINPSDDKVYVFLDKVFTEIAAMFPGPYIHVGGDECYKGYWAQDKGCQELMKKLNIRHVEDLQGYFMNKLEEILKSKGKKLIGWDEILEGGISPQATVMSWRGIKGGIEAAQMGHDVVMTPTTFAYLDYNQGEQTVDPPIYANLRLKKTYGYEPIPDGVDGKYILGGQGNLWTEQIPSLWYAYYMTYPRGWALAEVFWSPKETKNWENFVQRVENQFDRSQLGEVNFSRAIYDAVITTSVKDGKMNLNLESEVPDLDIYYTIDDVMPDSHANKYSKPVEMPSGNFNLRVITYRDGKPIGHLITKSRKQLESRGE